LLTLFITPIGSTHWIYNTRNGMYLALPISIALLMQIMEIQSDLNFTIGLNKIYAKFKMNKQEMLFAKIIILIFCFTFMLIFSFKYTYHDTSNRINMQYAFDYPKLKLVYTGREREKVVEELLNILCDKYIQKGDYLLAYEQISLIYFLTETKPYLYDSWPMVYSPEKFQAALSRAFQEREKLPLIVRAKRSTSNNEWPNNPKIGLINSIWYDSNRKIMKNFVNLHSYNIVWENNFFQILLAENNKY